MNIHCGRCRRFLKHYCRGFCRSCYQGATRKSRSKSGHRQPPPREPTAEELDALIASQLPTMPKEREFYRKEITDDSDVCRRVAGVCRVLLVPGRRKR